MNEIAGDILKAASEALYDPHVAGRKMVTGQVLLRVAGAIQAEREASEARMLALLKDPVAVRVNWLRGGINADSIIAEERECCAKICEAQKIAFLSPEYASNQPLGSMLERFACDECASAIRTGESP